MKPDEIYDLDILISKFQTKIKLAEEKVNYWTLCEHEGIRDRHLHKLARYDIILNYLQIKYRTITNLKNINS
jgi:hypothetical protein